MKEQRSLEISLKICVLSNIFPCQQCSPHHYFTGSPQEIKCTRGEALPGWWEGPCGEALASTATWAQPRAQQGQPGLFSQQDLMDHTNPSPFSLSGHTAAAFPAKRCQSQQLHQQGEGQVCALKLQGQVLVSNLKSPISISSETSAAARSGWALTQTRCFLSPTFNIREGCCPQIKVIRNPHLTWQLIRAEHTATIFPKSRDTHHWTFWILTVQREMRSSIFPFTSNKKYNSHTQSPNRYESSPSHLLTRIYPA